MAEVPLPEGVHYDEVWRVRLLGPDAATHTQELGESCTGFLQQLDQFHNIVGGFVALMGGLGKAVDQEKIKAIGARNLLKSISKQREMEQQQLQALIAERQAHLERLRLQYESLQKVAAEQEQAIEQFMSLS